MAGHLIGVVLCANSDKFLDRRDFTQQSTCVMEASPLTQQSRPDSFQPKVVQLYQQLFHEDEEIEKPEGFWEEFFLLKPDPSSLQQILDDLSPDDLLHLQVCDLATIA
jgi:hypothetical protein